MNKVKFDCEYYLNMIEQAQQLDDLPVIRVKLKRPLITFRFIYCLLFTIISLPIMILVLFINFFEWALLVFVWFCIHIGAVIYEYKTMNLKLFNPKQQDIYYCELTPNHFKWVFNEQIKEILWHQTMFIDTYIATRYEHARIEIYPTDSQRGKSDIILYDAHLPCYYRDLYDVIYHYRKKRRELVLPSI